MIGSIIRAALRALWAAFLLLPMASGASAYDDALKSDDDQPRPLVLALVGNYGPELEHYYFGETLKLIRRSIAPRALIVERLSPDTYLEAARNKSFDMSIASSGITHRALEFTGGSQILSVVRKEAPDPAKGTGTAIIVRADRDDLQTLSDLRQKSVATVAQSAFFGWQVPVAEMLLSGYDATEFFDTILETGPSMVRVFEAVRTGKADAGFVLSCMLEDLESLGLVRQGLFRVLDNKTSVSNESPGCRSSTRMYPSWAFSVTSSMDAPTAENIALSLLTLPPPQSVLRWTFNMEAKAPVAVFDRSDVPFYAHYRLQTFLRQYQKYIVAGILLLLIFILNSAVLSWLLRLRTDERERAIKQLYETQMRAELYEHQIARLEKTQALGVLSSMAAHELKQPLAAINNYAGTLRRQLQRRTVPQEMVLEAVQEIESCGSRMTALLDQVRGYARNESNRSEVLDLAELTKSICNRRRKADCVLDLEFEGRPSVRGNRLEIELMLGNLLKNAHAAAMTSASPRVCVRVCRQGNMAVLSVSDNGVRLSDEAFAHLGELFSTTKREGLGLGIPIVQSLCEAYGGKLVIDRADHDGDGLRFSLRLPALSSDADGG